MLISNAFIKTRALNIILRCSKIYEPVKHNKEYQ